MEFANVNWIAVIVGAIAAFLLGWLVYSPVLFIKRWAEGSGVDLDNSGPKLAPVVTQFCALLLLSLVVGMTAVTHALFTAIVAILACALFVISTGAFIGKSGFAKAVDGGYIIAAGVVMIAAQGLL